MKKEMAEKRLAAAKLRLQAASMLENAAAHERQANHPVYEGQEMICMEKANVIRNRAAVIFAEADLIEAEE